MKRRHYVLSLVGVSSAGLFNNNLVRDTISSEINLDRNKYNLSENFDEDLLSIFLNFNNFIIDTSIESGELDIIIRTGLKNSKRKEVKSISIDIPDSDEDISQYINTIDLTDGESTLSADLSDGEKGDIKYIIIETEINYTDNIKTIVEEEIEIEYIKPVNIIETSIELNNQTINMNVYEDTNADGVADNIDTYTLDNGVNQYEFNNIVGDSDYSYWLEFELESDNMIESPILNYAEINNINKWKDNWNDSKFKENIMLQNTSVRSKDEVRLGFDWNYQEIIKESYSYWSFDEEKGDDVKDSINDNDISITNPGSFGEEGLLSSNAYDNKRQGYGWVEYDSTYYKNNFSIIWHHNLKTIGEENQTWIDTRTPDEWDDGYSWRQLDEDRELSWNVQGSARIDAGDPIQTGEWEQYIMVHHHENNEARLYRNGELIGNESGTSEVIDSGRGIRFFDRSDVNGEELNGFVSDIIFLTYPINDEEAKSLWDTFDVGKIKTNKI